ncbi:MAG: Imm42 family immunity protein [Fimbriimonas sp.]
MRFGDPARFAIEYALGDPYHGVWMNGHVACWIGGRRVGNFETYDSLRDTLFQWDRIACDAGKRGNAGLFALGTQELLVTLRDGMFGDEGSPELVQRAVDEEWACHDVCPRTEPFFSWWIFLVEDAAVGRCVYGDLESETVFECRLRRGEFDAVLTEFRASLDAVLEREVATASLAGEGTV